MNDSRNIVAEPAKVLWHTGPNSMLGEGPLWSPEAQRVFWVDILGRLEHSVDAQGQDLQSREVPEQLTSIALDRSGNLVGTLRDGFARRSASGDWEMMVDVESQQPGNRFNDGKVDPFGNFWAGSMDDGETQQSGVLYRLSPQLDVSAADRGYVITNGPAFGIDGKTLYHTHSPQQTIYAFDLDASGISDKREHIRFTDEDGYPDGMTVDADGNLWVCHFAGSAISVYDEQGRRLRKIEMPVPNVTSATFGGEGFATLFVTTAAKAMTDAQRESSPHAGQLFALDVGARGRDSYRFGS